MTGSRIDELLANAREHVSRYSVDQAVAALCSGSLIVDLRPMEFRWRSGEIPGAVGVSRHLLEWRLDVTSAHRLKEIAPGDHDQEIVLLCDDGDASCLAAYQVAHSLGLTNVHSVIGGFIAWRDAGLPVVSRCPSPGPRRLDRTPVIGLGGGLL